MRDRPGSRRALTVTVALLIVASAVLGAAAMLGWSQIGFQVPLRGIVEVRVAGSQLQPVLTPLAVLVLATVAAVLATGGWARWLLGAALLAGAVLPAVGAARAAADEGWRTEATVAVALSDGLPTRSIPAGTATVLPAGPVLAAVGAGLLAAAGVMLVFRGHRMPRMGRRYQAPMTRNRRSAPADGPLRPDGHPLSQDGQWWERMDAGEDPTASRHPRDVTRHRTELASRPGSARGAEGEKLERPGGDPRRSQSGPR